MSVGGTLLINHFLPPPVPELSKDYGNDKPTYAITGQRNRADPWGKLPFLCGRFKQTPPYAALPYREAVGGDIYWRALFALGHGPIAIEEMRVGETLLSNFQGVDVEFRRGYWSMPAQGDWNAATGVFPSNPSFGDTWTCSVAGTTDGQSYRVGETITFNGLAAASSAAAWDRDQGKPFALFPNDVFEDPLAAAVTHATPVVRASQANADELSVELVFERGLVHIQNMPAGKRSDTSAAVRIEQSPTGQNQWTTVLERTITGRQVTPLFWGHRWKTADFGVQDANKQYDVRVSRLSGDMDEDRNFGNFSWYALRTFTTGSPVPVGAVAMLAMRIKSSGQLTGSIDEFNFVGRSICPRLRRGERVVGLAADVVAGGAVSPCAATPAAADAVPGQPDRPCAAGLLGWRHPAGGSQLQRRLRGQGLALRRIDQDRTGRPGDADAARSHVLGGHRRAEDRPGAAVHPAQQLGLHLGNDARGDAARLPHRLRQ